MTGHGLLRSGLIFVASMLLLTGEARSQDAAKSDASDLTDSAHTASRVEMTRGKNYAIVATDEFDAYLILDGDSMFDKTERVDHEKLDWRKLSKDLSKYRSSKDCSLMVHIYYREGYSGRDVLNWAMMGFGQKKARFKTTHWTNSHGDPTPFWDRINASVAEAEKRGQGSEEPIGNEFVQIRPVRKFITCLKTENANCIVKIVPQLVNKDRRLPGVIRASILKYIDQVEMPSRDKLLFEVNYHTDAKPMIEWLGDAGIQEIADQLGYQEATGWFAEYSRLLKTQN